MLPVLAVYSLLVAAQSPPGDDLAAEFAAALAADDIRAFANLAGDVPGGRRWASVVRLLEARDELRVSGARILERTPGEAPETERLLLELEGSAVAAGNRRPVSLPRHWIVELAHSDQRSKLVAAETLERLLATETVTESGGPDRILREHPELDVEAFLVELADLASGVDVEGLPAAEWALATSRGLHLPAAECASLEALSYLAVERGDLPAAQSLVDQLVTLARSTGNGDVLAGAYFTQGYVLWMSNQFDEGVSAYLRVGDLAGEADNPGFSLRALHTAAMIEQMQGRPRQALAIAKRHERLLQRHPSPRGLYDAAILTAEIHRSLGSSDVSKTLFEQARSIAQQSGRPGLEGVALGELASFDIEQRPAEAVALLERAIALAPVGRTEPSLFAKLHVLLGDARFRAGDLDGADASFRAGLGYAAPLDERRILSYLEHRLAELRLRQGKSQEALEHAESAVRHARVDQGSTRTSTARPLWLALTVRGRVLEALGRATEAELDWREAIDHLQALQVELSGESLDAMERLASTLAPFRELVGLLADQGRIDEALSVAEQMRGRALRDVLERGRFDVTAGLSPEQREREVQVESRLIALNRALLAASGDEEVRLRTERAAARLDLQQLRAEIALAHPPLGRRRSGLEAALPEEWWKVLPVGGRALELLVTEERTFAFLVSPKAGGNPRVTLRIVDIDAAELGSRVETLSRLLATRDPGFMASARHLHDLLIAPFAEEFAGASSLAVLPDGILWRVPFHVLPDTQGVPLIERLAVFRAPSLQGLRGLRRDSDRSPSLLALGDPVVAGLTAERVRSGQRGPELGPIPEARREVRALARLYGEGSKALIGEEARERVVKEDGGRYDVIHLATHALVDDEAPLFSALLLAAGTGEEEDGLMEVREIAELDLHARLVVLSACETALGRIHPGEGVMGMSWALLAAGAPAAVLSEWKVDSASTEQLMVRMHRELLRGASPAEALQRAQVALRRLPGRAHPYYWAGFTVLGAGWQ